MYYKYHHLVRLDALEESSVSFLLLEEFDDSRLSFSFSKSVENL